MKEALLYEKLEKGLVRCCLCSHRCRVAEQKFGFCGVRQNIAGVLYTHNYGKIIASHVDPIEKKPLYHFLPGSSSFSLAAIGCNFRCGFCQNWEISQVNAKEPFGLGSSDVFSPEELVKSALANKCRSISYTYTEPTIFFEYAYETAKLAKEKGLYNIFVTNGFMTASAIEMIRPYLDAANIDLKFFSDSAYKKICGGSLGPVLDSIRLMRRLNIWVEVTTLVVPGENDSRKELEAAAGFIAGVDRNIPWHISRFHPDYKFSAYPLTPEATLKKAQEIGHASGLTYIYAGNVRGWGSDTSCPNCKRLLIQREDLRVLECNVRQGRCVFCDFNIPGLF